MRQRGCSLSYSAMGIKRQFKVSLRWGSSLVYNRVHILLKNTKSTKIPDAMIKYWFYTVYKISTWLSVPVTWGLISVWSECFRITLATSGITKANCWLPIANLNCGNWIEKYCQKCLIASTILKYLYQGHVYLKANFAKAHIPVHCCPH